MFKEILLEIYKATLDEIYLERMNSVDAVSKDVRQLVILEKFFL